MILAARAGFVLTLVISVLAKSIAFRRRNLVFGELLSERVGQSLTGGVILVELGVATAVGTHPQSHIVRLMGVGLVVALTGAYAIKLVVSEDVACRCFGDLTPSFLIGLVRPGSATDATRDESFRSRVTKPPVLALRNAILLFAVVIATSTSPDEVQPSAHQLGWAVALCASVVSLGLIASTALAYLRARSTKNPLVPLYAHMFEAVTPHSCRSIAMFDPWALQNSLVSVSSVVSDFRRAS